MNDKTKLRTDKERLSGREFIYHKLFNNTLDAVILASPEGDILDANENACKMFGLTLAEIITGGRSRLMDLSDPRLQLALEERQRTGKFFGELTGIRKDGSKFPVEVASMIFKTDNGGEFTSLNFRETTCRKRLEKELEDRNEILSQFIKYSPIHSYIKDVTPTESRVVFASENFIDMIGIRGSEMIGKDMYQLFPPDFAEKITKDDWEVVSGGKLLKIDEELNNREYTTFKYPIKQAEKTYLAGYTVEITDLKIKERELEENEARLREMNSTKDKFFSIISHDLRSPFNSIVGFSNILVNQIKENDYEGVEKYAEIILQSSQRAMDLLRNLLEWSRAQTGRIHFYPEYIELGKMISEIIELHSDAASQKSITICRKTQKHIPAIADNAMISTVLRNLISNAIKFTNIGGEIVISAERNPNELIISVKDNGIGIEKSEIDKLFRIEETYSTSGTQNEKGTGLGLIICRDFIERHGGKIWVESEKGQGSTFSFTIPTSK